MKTRNIFTKLATLLLAGILSFSLAACGGGTATSANGASSASAPSGGNAQSSTNAGKTYKIGLVQLLENGAFADMREGFIARMAQLGYVEGENLEIDFKNAQGDMAALTSICQKMVDGKVDMIVTIATPPSQIALSTLQNSGSDIPLLFISVSDPITAGLVTTFENPDKNATGTSNFIPIDENFKLADKLTPGIKTYGFLYTTGEVNAVSTIADAKAYCDANGLAYVEKIVSNSSEIQQAAAALAGQCDAFFIPNDSVVQSAMPQVAQAAMDAKIPVYGSSAVMVASGAFATISVGDPETGAASADMADKILQGTPVANVPAIVVKDFVTVLNEDTAAAIGVTLPEDVLKDAVLLKGIEQ
ncbi:ABC transporter substrate-binding protein [Ruminococcaceae bacterium OttesenSCG-928-A16]|nr:ABC transporter substrate-binding protein [Ruminococcaceae bacterium OttesenSCG-928-A16]